MSQLTKKEKYLIENYKLSQEDVIAISEIGRVSGTNKYNVWIAQQIKAFPDLIKKPQDIQYVIDWAVKIRPNISEMSFEQAFENSKTWHDKIVYDEPISLKIEKEEEEGKILYRSRDGKHFFLLLFPEDLKTEGDLMRHCVGGYTEKVKQGKSLIVSLRDEKNEPHVTIEIDSTNGATIQVRGKANADPAPKYQKLIAEFAICSSGEGDNIDRELMELMELKFD